MLSTYESAKLHAELFDRNRTINWLTLDKLDLEKELRQIENELEKCESKLTVARVCLILSIIYSIFVTILFLIFMLI